MIDHVPQNPDTMMTVQQYIEIVITAENQMIEAELEKALAGGKYGVKVVRDYMGILVSVEVDPSVPFAHLYEYRVQTKSKEVPW